MIGNEKPILEIRQFRGINNIDDPERALPRGDSSFLTAGVNIDIDNTLKIHRRAGYAQPVYRGAGIHSVYSDGGPFLFVQGSDLKALNPDYSAATIRAAVGDARMNYVTALNRIFCTNNSIIGGVQDGAWFDFNPPAQTYKRPMPPGHLIEWFNGRLCVARGREIWFSDPMFPAQTDRRRGFKSLEGYVRLLAAVRDGIYVSSERAMYFMAGMTPEEFSLIKIADYPAIPGTSVKVDAELIGQRRFTGKVVLWLTADGICMGASEGFFKNLTGDFYCPRTDTEGAAVLRPGDYCYQYLVSQRDLGDLIYDMAGAPLNAEVSAAADVTLGP